MFSTSSSLVAATIALSALSPVYARVVPRLTTPSTYDMSTLEPYFTYHARYLALGCEYNHGNDFFDACCHPLQINESLSNLEPRCTPDAGVLSSVSESLEGYTSTSSWWSSTSASSTPSPTASPVEDFVPATSDTWTPTSTWSSSSDTWTSTSTASAASSTQSGGFGTFFYQKGVAGACGTVHSDSDVIVAMDSALYSQSVCGQTVTIWNTANWKSVTATIADECPTCINSESIDMSVGAFQQIGDLSTGQLDIVWIWDL
ncbi:barwin-like endoglucanase [Gymnopus androsaceus JB14]|uniref:Barwin-like endoglucanase n=1 Tax=Gymnopus androsaceus JB14 TaxID=1447944 RepID=A0A6A4HUW3_9AGAR|nr:barwin-like endoglucanase [Gymnopus androsaceus JB14]